MFQIQYIFHRVWKHRYRWGRWCKKEMGETVVRCGIASRFCKVLTSPSETSRIAGDYLGKMFSIEQQRKWIKQINTKTKSEKVLLDKLAHIHSTHTHTHKPIHLHLKNEMNIFACLFFVRGRLFSSTKISLRKCSTFVPFLTIHLNFSVARWT